MKVFDSEITDRGTKRKVTYMYYGQDKEAKRQALKDFNAEKRKVNSNEEIKHYKHLDTIDYWLKFERAAKFRYGI